MKELLKFMEEREQAVKNHVSMIVDDYMVNGEKSALTMLNDLILTNNLKKWEACVLESKVCRELTNRGVFTRTSETGECK